MAPRSGTSTKSWMPAGAGEEYNTLSVMKDMGKNMTNGALALKWPTRTPSTGGKKKMGQRFETHSNLLSGEGCKPAYPDLRQYAHGRCHHTHGRCHHTHGCCHHTHGR